MHRKICPIVLVSNLASSVVVCFKCLHDHNFVLEHPICFEQIPQDAKFHCLTELFTKVDHTISPICDNSLITLITGFPIPIFVSIQS